MHPSALALGVHSQSAMLRPQSGAAAENSVWYSPLKEMHNVRLKSNSRNVLDLAKQYELENIKFLQPKMNLNMVTTLVAVSEGLERDKRTEEKEKKEEQERKQRRAQKGAEENDEKKDGHGEEKMIMEKKRKKRSVFKKGGKKDRRRSSNRVTAGGGRKKKSLSPVRRSKK